MKMSETLAEVSAKGGRFVYYIGVASLALAAGLASNDSVLGLVEADLRAVVRATDLDAEVLTRSRITVLEQTVSEPHGYGISGTPVEGGSVTTDLVTVGQWHNVGGQMQPM